MTDDGTQELDCRTCGACCSDASDGRVLVSAEDLVKWRKDRREDILANLVPGHFGQLGFAARSDGRCIHLGSGPSGPESRSHDCAIYAHRAESCRAVEVGSRECMSYRQALGLTTPSWNR